MAAKLPTKGACGANRGVPPACAKCRYLQYPSLVVTLVGTLVVTLVGSLVGSLVVTHFGGLGSLVVTDFGGTGQLSGHGFWGDW